MSKIPESLLALRAEINALDDQILRLLATRYKILEQVVKVKAEHGLSHHLKPRVIEVLERNEALGISLGLPANYAHDLYQLIIDKAHEFEAQHLPT